MSLLERAVEARTPGYADALAAALTRRRQWREDRNAAPVRRRKLWEIGTAHHCAVIGTCLTVAELRKIARHAGMDDADTASDYELHHSAVHHAQERNAMSALMQKELERKFALALRRCAAMKEDREVRSLWQQAVLKGEVAGMLWAIVTHPAASEATLSTIAGELHMLSHQTGAASRADLQRLAVLEQDKRELGEQLRRQQNKAADEIKRKNALVAVLERRVANTAAMELRLQDAERRVHELEDSGALAQARRLLAAETLRARRAEDRMQRLAATEVSRAQLETALAESRRECEALERALHHALARVSCGGQPGGACAADLAGRCILYVGGRTGLVDHYRVLVEQCRGRFVHHDGGLEDSIKRLQPLLTAADCVVCASGNVSHGAYYVVKRYCKQDGKPCVLLRNASLSAFVNGIRMLVDGAACAREGDTVLRAENFRSASQERPVST